MSFVVKRRIDSLGRVVLPADYRNHFNIKAGDSVQLTLAENGMIVSKEVKNTNITKPQIVDELGRIKIPDEILKEHNWCSNDTLEISAEYYGILLNTYKEDGITQHDFQQIFMSEKNKKDIFEKDYSDEWKQNLSSKKINEDIHIFDTILDSGVLKSFDQSMIHSPHVINISQKKTFERSLQMLDELAKSFGGKIYSEINYEDFGVFIRVYLPFFEFYGDGTIECLRYISQVARAITFENTDANQIRMTVRFDYFDRIEDNKKESMQYITELAEKIC